MSNTDNQTNSASNLKQQIFTDMKSAMKARDKKTLDAIRLLTARIKQKEVDERKDITDADVLDIVTKMLKQGEDAASQFKQANRPELAEHEQEQIKVFSKYLPAQMSEQDVLELVESVISETNAASMQDMGKVMAILKPKCQGAADMGALSKLVRAKLTT